MTGTLILILALCAIILIFFAIFDDIDTLRQHTEPEECECQRYFIRRGCPIHDPERKAA